MALEPCAECGRDISTVANACPHCDAPQAIVCPNCGARTVVQVDGLQGAENLAGFILLALAIIPGIAYYFDRTRMPWCKTADVGSDPRDGVNTLRHSRAAGLDLWLVRTERGTRGDTSLRPRDLFPRPAYGWVVLREEFVFVAATNVSNEARLGRVGARAPTRHGPKSITDVRLDRSLDLAW
jgi:hypothetical protein